MTSLLDIAKISVSITNTLIIIMLIISHLLRLYLYMLLDSCIMNK